MGKEGVGSKHFLARLGLENNLYDNMKNAGCVLLAEDDGDDVFLLNLAFRRAGVAHILIDLPDGERTVEYLKGSPPFDDRLRYPFPQLLLLDLKMPKLNGFDVLAWIAGRPDMTQLPVVVLSASPLESDIQLARRLGAREFLIKPSDFDKLVRLAGDIDLRWLGGNSPSAAAEVPFVAEPMENKGRLEAAAVSWCPTLHLI